jgi:hypothetical protein
MAIVDLYKVIWHNNRHNNANQQTNVDYVVAATNSKAEALATTIQANNGDGKTVTVENIFVIQKGIIQ